jgi:hypothetical protein
MTDTHIHIGQFKEIYYTAEEVFNVVFASGSIDHLVFSSTTSCVEGIVYGAVAAEIENALKLYGAEKTAPSSGLSRRILNKG